MHFAGLNYLAVFFAGAASFAFGAGYYMTFGKWWMTALGKTREDIERSNTVLPFIVTAVAEFLMAYILAGAIGHLGEGMVTIRNGVITGLFMWVGFVVTTMAVNYAFQGAKPMLSVIDGAHWLGVLLLQGLIIGWIGI